MSAPNFIVSQPDKSAATIYDQFAGTIGTYTGPIVLVNGFSFVRAWINTAQLVVGGGLGATISFIQTFSSIDPIFETDVFRAAPNGMLNAGGTVQQRTFWLPIFGNTLQVTIGTLPLSVHRVNLAIYLIP